VNSHPSATAQQTSQTNAEVSYDHQGQHQLWSVLADWYAVPESQFRFRFGLSHDDNVENIVAYEAGMGGYNIGNNHYSAAQVGKLQGVIRSNGFVPYLGLGWGNPVLKNKHWGFMVDVGAIYPGQTNVTLTSNITVLPTDLEAERVKLLDSRRRVTVLITIGVSYQW
jgi:hypothetical protein